MSIKANVILFLIVFFSLPFYAQTQHVVVNAKWTDSNHFTWLFDIETDGTATIHHLDHHYDHVPVLTVPAKVEYEGKEIDVKRIGHHKEDLTETLAHQIDNDFDLVISEGITELIGEAAGTFQKAENLRNVTLPKSLKKIGTLCFQGCTNMKLVPSELDCELTSIGANAFADCTSMEAITLKGSLDEAAAAVFNNTHMRYINLQNLQIVPGKGTTMAGRNEKLKSRKFYGIPNHTLIYMPKGSEKDFPLVPGEVNFIYADADGKNAYCEHFQVDDKFDTEVPLPFKAKKSSYINRTFGAGRSATLCLPYEATLPAGMSAFTFSRREGDTFVFEPFMFTTLEANEPYLLKASHDGTAFSPETTEKSIPISKAVQPTGASCFIGTTVNIDNATAAGWQAYNLKNNIWNPIRTSTPSGSIGHYRCGVVDTEEPSSGAKFFMMGFVTPTGIEIPNVDASVAASPFYTIDGILVRERPLPAGIYVSKGKKVIINR
uniref:Leucine-rich repeat domain-containing protein n=1 Tax=Prevotella sp. GTC17262 TaxID=3236797 RepID=A0AB33JLN6_9BACT